MRKYRPLLRYWSRHGCSVAAIGGLTVLASLLAAAQPWPMKLVVDQVLTQRPPGDMGRMLLEWFGLASSANTLLAMAVAGGLVLFALISAVDVWVVRLWTTAGRRMVYDLSEEMFARLQRRSLAWHTRHRVGDAMSRVTEDCWCIYRALEAGLMQPFQAALTLALMIALMARLDSTLAVIAVGMGPFMVGASFLVGRPLRAAARLKREIESRIQAHVQRTLTGIPVVQAFAQEDREHEKFERYADAAVRAQQYTTLLGGLNSLSTGLVTTLGIGVILWVGAHHVLDGRLTIGGMLVFIVYLGTLQNQMRTLAGVHSTLRNAQAGADRVLSVLGSESDLPEKPGAIELPAPSAQNPRLGEVTLENVCFGYETGQPVLRGVSLRAKPGEIIAIVGPSGAGKTTLVNLIPRFLDPQHGRVLVNGHDVRELNLRSLREHVAIVLQEPFLFPLTVAENIAYGRPTATRAEVQAAAVSANADGFIRALPQGYDTLLDERGTNLSGGQRQRLAIARALLRNAPILILDEPTSALDPEAEREVMAALERLMAGRTVFLIAHRLSTARLAHRIVVLQEGVVAESGTHDELMARGQIYSRLSRLQSTSGQPEPGSQP